MTLKRFVVMGCTGRCCFSQRKAQGLQLQSNSHNEGVGCMPTEEVFDMSKEKKEYKKFRDLLRGGIGSRTQKAFAKEAGISAEHLSRMLNSR